MELLQIYRWADIGWETVAECENCVQTYGDLSGCPICGGKGWRQLTEEEELSLHG